MERDVLRNFLSLAEHLNYVNAARELGSTSSALSDTVAALERQMGVLLVSNDMKSSTVRLTQAGETLKALAPEFLQMQDRITHQVQAAGKPLLRVAVSEAMSILDVRVKLHRQQQPDDRWAFTLIRMPLSRQRTEIKLGEFDAGLSQTASSSQDQGLVVEMGWHEPLIALMPKDHPLHEHEKLQPAMIASHPLMLVNNAKQGAGYGEQIVELLRGHGLPDLIAPKQLNTYGEMILSVLDRRGIGLMGAAQWANSGPVMHLAARPVADAQTDEPLRLTTYLRRPETFNPALSEAMAQFRERLKTAN